MKKILTATVVSLLLIACNSGSESTSIETIIASKDIKAINAKKTELQTQLAQLDEAMKALKGVDAIEALVTVSTLKDTVFSHSLEIQGNVNTNQNVLVQPEMPGNLIALNVKAGQNVTKGQILGRTDDGGMSQQLASAENQYALAKTMYDRQKNLWNQKIGSEMQYLQAQTQMISAQKAVSQIKAQIGKTIIRAPFSGTIDEVFAEKGEVVAPSPTGLMRIVNLNNMYISTSVPETYIGKLKIGTEVEVYLSALGKSYKGKIRQIGNFINPNNRSFGIEVSVPNPEKLLRPNQVAQLKVVDYKKDKAIVVPSNIIQEDGQKNKYVFVVANAKGNTGTAKKVIVTLGQSSNNVTEIVAGLNANEIIVTEGMNAISEGMKLNF
ncbi:efflux RND transporter periplasmic adaptor subunit [Flavobacterium sp. RSSA_27]|uniref:efflux RND transporter periplasmic adaptor subunit n=1 Tax=Flavobacterium sp. RSSA_27 TaxID=3447667 RepID=UPI003F3A0ED5